MSSDTSIFTPALANSSVIANARHTPLREVLTPFKS